MSFWQKLFEKKSNQEPVVQEPVVNEIVPSEPELGGDAVTEAGADNGANAGGDW